jgi:hypothetical protein
MPDGGVYGGTKEATDKQLSIFGLYNPQMVIQGMMENGDSINFPVGDSTPDGQAYCIKLASSRDLYTVDYT